MQPHCGRQARKRLTGQVFSSPHSNARLPYRKAVTDFRCPRASDTYISAPVGLRLGPKAATTHPSGAKYWRQVQCPHRKFATCRISSTCPDPSRWLTLKAGPPSDSTCGRRALADRSVRE